MRAKCVICDCIDKIPDDDPLAKKLRNRPIHTYTCPDCYERIARSSYARIEAKKKKKDREYVE